MLGIKMDQDYTQFIHNFKNKTGIDLHLYKEQQMKRRLIHLRDKKGYSSFGDFYKALVINKELLIEVMDHMTINVSEFFRNPNRWKIIEKKIIPELMKSSFKVKCWSAACSTGEEPYTLAMLLSSATSPSKYHITATDIDLVAMDRAKKGYYPLSSVKEVPKTYLSKYFRQENRQYLLSDEIKRQIKFKQQNLLADPFEQGFDLIVCRNVLIYFTEEGKDIIFSKFSKSLKKGGYLFVGGTEQIYDPIKYGLQLSDAFLYKKSGDS